MVYGASRVLDIMEIGALPPLKFRVRLFYQQSGHTDY